MDFVRKSVDTAAAVGRLFNGQITRQLFSRICPRCNNLSPYDHHDSSDKSMGFLDDTSQSERAAYAPGAVWLSLEFKVQSVAKAIRKIPCLYCRVILRAIKHYCPHWFVDNEVDPDLDEKTSVTLLMVSGRPAEVHAVEFGSFEISDAVAVLDDAETKENPVSFLPHCAPLAYRAPLSDDPSVWKFVLEAIQRCSMNHQRCQRSTNLVSLPKRLLDIGVDGSSIRLIETKSGDQGQYATVSHCWGGGKPLRTFGGNLKRHKSGISRKALNATFKDAVLVAQTLGLRYVWIDSLCIIQDSPKDWAEQASQMASIYQNATITIALGSSAGPKQSIFCERDADWVAWDLDYQVASRILSFKIRRKALHAQAQPNRAGYGAADTIRRASDQEVPFSYAWPGPLYKRAWCLQEQLLSKRMLHFTPGSVIWECQSERQIEGEVVISKQCSVDDATNQAARWKRVVENYTGRDVTYDTDRLVALAGAAQDMAKLTNDRYMAGMWAQSLLWNLLWHPSPFSQSAPSGCGAPSWSWASVTGQIVFEHHFALPGTTVYAVIKHSETIPRSVQSPFADVKSGHLIVHGPTVQARLYLNVKDEIFPSATGGPITGIYASWEKPEQGHYVLTDTRPYETEIVSSSGETIRTCRRAKLGEPYYRDWGDTDEEPGAYDIAVTILCFWHSKALDVCGLVLGRSATEPGAYCRVAQVFKVPLEYVKRASLETVKIV